MPKHDSKRKAEIRAHMERTGLPYAAAAAAVEAAARRTPDAYDPEDGLGRDRVMPYAEIDRRINAAGDVIDHETQVHRAGGQDDPYRRAAAFEARSMGWLELAAHAEGSNFHAACMLASFHDQETAARIRFEHRIPTLFPKSMAAQAGLQCCEWCGRPWQADPEGACEHCPRLMWGPAPRSADQARTGPAPIPVTREQLRPAPAYDD
ncbi:hypothetical protein AW27_034245 (plasmid) [Streptomyces sp. PCS3-D2]|uniref:hypothetical protein n=1 Tax=Streptomyces sp. PCS3-D2 TaxID=1460244 RepID=UPI00044CDC65|nr:hypothetical protein [Streptomyces sp. PCS3-D2]WKV76612.1 hypothetical protein AW27_034245 [Streptomyces sp. PCS3-D2]